MSDSVGRQADPKKWYSNPSIGLVVWGPLVPASDCKSCLYSLIGFQTVCGVAFVSNSLRYKFQRVRSRTFRFFARSSGTVAGLALLCGSLLEVARVQLPNDPWTIDAKAARRRDPESNNGFLNKWMGPKGYRAITLDEWVRRMSNNNVEGFNRNVSKEKIEIAHVTYDEMRRQSREASRSILTQLQQDKQFPVQEDPEEEVQQEHNQHRQPQWGQGNDSNQKDQKDQTADEEVEWDFMLPIEHLGEETDITVRLLPHTRGVMEPIETSHEEISVTIPAPKEDADL
uniref:ARAD1D47630p n=1 Tax=Blastobotrys adeninivorans TaxID=409370 RepID=A0A060TDG3_BLAAD